MAREKVLAIVQAGGVGGRMDVLTRERAKPALPFAGVHQLIDFSLSSLTHSGISDVWLSVEFQGAGLQDEVANGRPWDLDRNLGGLRLLMPQEGTGGMDEEGFSKGNADELFRIRDQVIAFDPDVLLVMSADHVYRLDFTEVLETHRRKEAECTVVTAEVALEEAGDHATVEHNRLGRVTRFEYKPDKPTTGTVAAEIFAYRPDVLIEVLEELHRELAAGSEQGDTGLEDFGDHLVPRLVDRGKTFVHPLGGYWRDLGQPHKYLKAHHDVLTEDVGVLSVPGWPILSRLPQRAPARVLEGAEVVDSMLSSGGRVGGAVRRSVLGPGVVVEAGAEVTNSVVFADTTVRAGAQVHWSIVDTGCEIKADAQVGDADVDPLDDADQVTIVGRDSVVGQGVRLTAGSRLEPGTVA